MKSTPTATLAGPAGSDSLASTGGNPGWLLWTIVALSLAAGLLLPSILIDDPTVARALSIAIVCLVLWLSEVVPSFVPTIVLWASVPLLLGSRSDSFALRDVLGWSADPVMPLFFGGFALSVAASKYGLDGALAGFAIRLSRGERLRLLALTAFATAFLSMWMSNIAAAAMMIVALRPLLNALAPGDHFRRAMLLCIAFGADFGGISTPIGSGPNAIAIAAASRTLSVTFVEWMAFGIPLAILLIAAAIALVHQHFGGSRREPLSLASDPTPIDSDGRRVVAIALGTILLWLTEPFHGVPAAVVALAGTAALFLARLLDRHDLQKIDWATLLLIGGGLGLGRLLEQSGVIALAASAIRWESIPHYVVLLALCLASAFLSALMSNTGTATMLIPLAGTISPEPSTAILIAISSSLGIPFVISTPPNAMVYGEGGLEGRDFLVPGMLIMVVGCVVVSLSGPFVLGLIGIP
jgi:sodium-dependent dicarboxylate transporter 2/3/5